MSTKTATKATKATSKTTKATLTTSTAKDRAPIGDLSRVATAPNLTQVRDAWTATGKSQAKRDLTISRYLKATGKSARDLSTLTGWSRGTIGNADRSGALLDRMIGGGYVPSTDDAAMTAEVARWNADRISANAPKGYDALTGSALRDTLRAMIDKAGKQHAKNATGARKSQEEKKPETVKVAGVETDVPVRVKSATHEATDEVKGAAVMAVLPTIGSGISLAMARQIASQAARILKAAEAAAAAEAKAAAAAQAEADATADEAATAADDEATKAPAKRTRRTKAA
jgi:hypothetical protein